MALYVALIAFVTWASKFGGLAPPWSYLVGASPALPVGGVILAVMRFIDQSDEYVRAVTIRRFVLAAGMTLFVCTTWGFAESFADAPHVPMWVVFPAFWAFYGAAYIAVRDSV
jgi:hypothetical protein